MTPGDTIRLCPHPEWAPHPSPAKLPAVRGQSVVLTAVRSFQQPPTLHRCTVCGIVGEPAIKEKPRDVQPARLPDP